LALSRKLIIQNCWKIW